MPEQQLLLPFMRGAGGGGTRSAAAAAPAPGLAKRIFGAGKKSAQYMIPNMRASMNVLAAGSYALPFGGLLRSVTGKISPTAWKGLARPAVGAGGTLALGYMAYAGARGLYRGDPGVTGTALAGYGGYHLGKGLFGAAGGVLGGARGLTEGSRHLLGYATSMRQLGGKMGSMARGGYRAGMGGRAAFAGLRSKALLGRGVGGGFRMFGGGIKTGAARAGRVGGVIGGLIGGIYALSM